MGKSRARKKAKGGAPFRKSAKKWGLTYSCPVDVRIHPMDDLWEDKTMLKHIQDCIPNHKIIRWTIGHEKHDTNGKNHYHVFLELMDPLETENCRIFDILKVHPNICKGTVGKGWEHYCVKHGSYVTNYFEPCPYSHARDLAAEGDSDAAVKHLWTKRPRDMALHGAAISANLRLKKKSKFSPTLYYGPYWPIDWDDKRYTLILEGEPGLGKTQWAKWWGATKGGYFYCKGSLECMKHYAQEPAIIFDDINVDKCKDLTDVFDVENGGCYEARYQNADIPAGVPRVWLQNPGVQIPDPYGRIIGRRAIVRTFS